MKRYFALSLTLFAFSVLNVLTYFLLGVITGNTAFSGIFSITYPLQFVVSTLLCFFATASSIRANKEGNKNCVNTGMVLGLLFGIAIFAIIAVFVDKYIAFMNMEANIYRNFTLMAIGQLFLSYVCNLVTEKLYFENKDKFANFCSLGFMILNLLTVCITALITKNQIIILAVNLSALFVYVAVWFAINLKKFKFDFSIIKNFRYESMSIVGEIFMLIIYLFGFRLAFSFGQEYYIALSFINLITDPIWDAVVAIPKIAKIDISQSCFNYRKALKMSAAISIFFIAVGIVCFFSLFKVYKAVLTIGIIYLVIQIADIFMNILKGNLQTFMQLEYSPTKATIIGLLSKVIRTILAVFLFTPFNTDIAQISCGFIALVLFLIIRFRNFKMDKEGFLIRKEKIPNQKSNMF